MRRQDCHFPSLGYPLNFHQLALRIPASLPRQLLLLVGAVLVLSACPGRRGGFTSPYEAGALEKGAFAVSNLEELRAALLERTGRHGEIWMRSDVTITREGERGRDFFTALVLYREPELFRLRGSRIPVGTVFDVLLSGDEAYLHFNREGQLFVGTLEELASKAGLIGGLTPRDLVSAVLVQQNLSEWLASPMHQVAWRDGGEHLLVASRHPANGRQILWLVRKDDALVREVLIRSPRGEEELRIEFLRYQLESADEGAAEPFPADFVFTVPGRGVVIRSEGAEYKVAPGLDDRAFAPPRARDVYPLSSLHFEETR